MDFRPLILTELARRQKIRFWLCQQLPALSRQTIYDYLSGRRDVRSDTLSAILDVLKIVVK